MYIILMIIDVRNDSMECCIEYEAKLYLRNNNNRLKWRTGTTVDPLGNRAFREIVQYWKWLRYESNPVERVEASGSLGIRTTIYTSFPLRLHHNRFLFGCGSCWQCIVLKARRGNILPHPSWAVTVCTGTNWKEKFGRRGRIIDYVLFHALPDRFILKHSEAYHFHIPSHLHHDY